MQAADQVDRAAVEHRRAAERELEEAEYEASFPARCYKLVDPAERHIAREMEAWLNTTPERVEQIEQRLVGLATIDTKLICRFEKSEGAANGNFRNHP